MMSKNKNIVKAINDFEVNTLEINPYKSAKETIFYAMYQCAILGAELKPVLNDGQLVMLKDMYDLFDELESDFKS